MKEHYGIVIDSGSSGSRLQVYRWADPAAVKSESREEHLLKSVPQIYQEESWTLKTTPGVSSFAERPEQVWDKHYEDLVEYAEKIIPKSSWNETPIFIQATAGMRMVPQEKSDKLLSQICKSLKKHSNFLVEDCDSQIEIIDGELEGIYGWVAVNYLMDQLDDYDVKEEEHTSYGFMDMGGASQQIAFVPSRKSEIEKHKDDISKVILRNVNGEVQEWNVFVSTWLGFGANEARNRYLNQLINLLPEKNNKDDKDDFNTKTLNNPCLPKNAKYDYEHKGHTYEFIGSGDYEQCLKTTYPLLLKNLPCKGEPCLFNGVHAPEIDFYKDKFVGVSEYWYTANDIFHMGGEYNFLKVSEKVQLFCETDWHEIQENSKQGQYNNIKEPLLLDACFKANWVLNVLHEGFNLPRTGIETKIPEELEQDFDNHIPFQSAGTIKGSELSWTLGKILLYASSQIEAKDGKVVGVQPTNNEVKTEHKKFIFGTIGNPNKSTKYSGFPTFPLFLVILLLGGILYSIFYKRSNLNKAKTIFHHLYSRIHAKYDHYRYSKLSNQIASDLEEGLSNISPGSAFDTRINDISESPLSATSQEDASNLRTRSFANLQTSSKQKSKKSLRTANSLLDFSKFTQQDPIKRSISASFVHPSTD